jgi:hypothetical protein
MSEEATSEETSGNVDLPWYGEVDTDTKGYLENKGWKAPGDLINGYRNLEKLMGHDRAGRTVTIPKEGEDASEFYSKLGRPESPDKYDLGEVGGKTVDWFRSEAHKLGLSQSQAKTLLEGFNEYSGSLTETQKKDQEVEFTNQMHSLKSDWGSAYDANMNAAKKAVQQFGFTTEDLDAMQSALGPKKVFERMYDIGRALSEDSFESGQRESGFVMSPAEAINRINELKLDNQFMDKYMSGDKIAVEKFTKLMQAAYP